MAVRALAILVLLAAITCSTSSSQPPSTPAPVRSYAQAAQPANQQVPPSPQSEGGASNQPSRSYAQAANNNQQSGTQTGGNTPPPRSYAQASNNNNQQTGGNTPPPRSYAQASNNNNQQAGGNTPPPRSYAQASNNNQGNQRITTPRPYRGSPNQSPARTSASANVTDDELRNFSEELLRGDVNNEGSNIRANWQARTYGSNPADLAPAPLLSVPARALQSPTISKLRLLFDNYEPDSARAEVVTATETNENSALLDAIVSTQVMAKTRQFLVSKGMLNNSPTALRTLLQKLWFTMYPRLGGRSEVGSSAFEHVFLAEIRRGEVSGLHNWVFFAAEETTGKADYLGYIRRIDLGGKGSIVKHHFRWANVTKPVGSMFIGTSPELEMALYTVCYIARPDERCAMRLAGEPFFIKTHSFTYRGHKYIGSAFPDI